MSGVGRAAPDAENALPRYAYNASYHNVVLPNVLLPASLREAVYDEAPRFGDTADNGMECLASLWERGSPREMLVLHWSPVQQQVTLWG